MYLVKCVYNEDGLRTQKTHNGTTTDYYYNGSVLIGMQSGNITQRFSYDAQGKVVSVDYSENGGSTYTTYYYLRNAQGDIVKLIDNGGDTKVEYTYDSWGKVLATTGDHAGGVGLDQPFRYRGYVYDTETGWYYLQSRYYNPEVGRFISSDVYLSTGQGVLGHNSYAYCLNNSVNAEDPTGYWGWFTGGRNRENVADGGTGLFGFSGWDCRYRYNNRNGYSSGYSSSHSNRYTSGTNRYTRSYGAGVQTGNAKEYSVHSSSNAAFRAAKMSAGIPMSEQPLDVVKSVDRAGKIIPGRTYIFKNGIEIRQHSAGHVFEGGVRSSAHYNVSISKWHYFYIN